MFPPQTLRSIKNQRGLEGVEAILLISVTGICVALVLPDFNHILNYLNENKSFGDALSLRASELSYAFIGVKTLAALALVLIAGYLIYFILDFIVEFLRVLYRKVKPDPTDVCVKAWNAFYRHDYEKAYPLFKSLAEQGNSSAQCGLGLMHENGFATPENFEEAIRLYRLAANIGEARGQYLLACMYEM